MELQEKQILNPKELTTIQPGDLEIPNHSTVSGFCGNQSWKKSFCWQIPSLPTLISIHKIGNLQIVPEQDIFQTSKDCKSCPSQFIVSLSTFSKKWLLIFFSGHERFREGGQVITSHSQG